LSGYLRFLIAANSAVTDPETKSLTDDFIEAGKKFRDAFRAYGTMIDYVINGSNLDSNSVDQTKTIMEDLKSSTLEVNKSSEALAAFFFDTLETDFESKTGASAPVENN
jgi:argininosuccinate lyase